MAAYAKMQFTEMSQLERDKLRAGLIKYCELDTFAGDEAAIQNLGYLLQQDDNGNKKRLAKKSIKQLTLETEQGNSD